MVTAVLPLYLVLALDFTPLQFGIVDGIYEGVTTLVRLAGGYVADRWRRHKEVAAAGCGLSAVCKLGLLAGGGWAMISSAHPRPISGGRSACTGRSTPPAR